MLSRAVSLSTPVQRPALEARLAALAPKVAAEERSRINFIQSLPVEILSLIGRFYLETSPHGAVILASVCRHWRAVYLSDPSLWRELRLSSARPSAGGRVRAPTTLRKMAVAWLQRSGGSLDALSLSVSSDVEEPLFELLGPVLGTLESFTWIAPASPHFLERLEGWRGRFVSLRRLSIQTPKALHTGVEEVSRRIWGILSSANRLVDLRIDRQYLGGLLEPPPELGVFLSLRTLHLNITGAPGLAFLPPERFPALEHVDVPLGMLSRSVRLALHPPDQPEPLVYSGVTSLKAQAMQMSIERPEAVFPNLRRLELTRSFLPAQETVHSIMAGFLALPRDHTLGLASGLPRHPLTHLDLSRSPVTEAGLLQQLVHLPSLAVLRLSNCNLTNATVIRLIIDNTVHPLCPLLEELNLSYSDELTGGPLCRMVASRRTTRAVGLASDEGDGGVPETAIFRKLLVDGCTMIESAAIEWLRVKLETFSCSLIVRKA